MSSATYAQGHPDPERVPISHERTLLPSRETFLGPAPQSSPVPVAIRRRHDEMIRNCLPHSVSTIHLVIPRAGAPSR